MHIGSIKAPPKKCQGLWVTLSKSACYNPKMKMSILIYKYNKSWHLSQSKISGFSYIVQSDAKSHAL